MKEYEIESPDGSKYTVQLDDEEAKRLGLTPVKAAVAPANKARKAAPNKKA